MIYYFSSHHDDPDFYFFYAVYLYFLIDCVVVVLGLYLENDFCPFFWNLNKKSLNKRKQVVLPFGNFFFLSSFTRCNRPNFSNPRIGCSTLLYKHIVSLCFFFNYSTYSIVHAHPRMGHFCLFVKFLPLSGSMLSIFLIQTGRNFFNRKSDSYKLEP